MCEYMSVHECSREGLKDGVELTQTARECKSSPLSAGGRYRGLASVKALSWAAAAPAAAAAAAAPADVAAPAAAVAAPAAFRTKK